MKILIVEDKEENRYLLEALLNGHGHEVLSADNGAEALKLLNETDGINLVISDILMPIMDGFQLTREIRSSEQLKNLPIIIYTATYTGPKDEEFALSIGANRFIIKPCEPEVFLEAMDTLMVSPDQVESKLSQEKQPEEKEYLKLYNTRLIQKLERKMLEVEQELHARQEAEKTLRQSEQLLKNITENMFDLVVLTNVKGDIVYASASHKKIGYEPETLVGHSIFEFIHTEDHDHSQDHLLNIPETPGSNKRECRLKCADGRYIWVETIGSILANGKEENTTLIFSSRDISERKEAEEALRKSEILFRGLFDNHAAVKLLIDTETDTITDANQAAVKFYGWPLDALRTMTLEDLCNTDNKSEKKETVAGAIPEHSYSEANHKLADGSVRDVAVFSSDIEVHGKTLHHSIVHDITELKQAEAEREKLREQFLQAQKMEAVGHLAGGVAHDFNNMLNVILGYVDILLFSTDQDEKSLEYIDMIHDAAMRSVNLTRQLLAFARKQKVNPETLNLSSTIEGSLEILRRLIGENITLTWKPGANIRSIIMDLTQVDQILANLAVNARDAIPDVGRIVIETANTSIDKEYCEQYPEAIPGEYVMLVVSDTGSGMDKTVLEHLFEPFFTTKEVGKGTGLGLATVYGIVKQNQGFINVYSEIGQGTTFRIYFPCAPVSEHTLAEKSAKTTPTGDETLLVVEDEESMLDLSRRLLEKLGYNILTASSPEKALTLCEEYDGDIHLLLTDVVMPKMNGRMLAEKVSDIRPDIKVLFMSGYSGDIVAGENMQGKDFQFLPKPFSLQILSEKVRAVLDCR